jgi:hypothetical protein
MSFGKTVPDYVFVENRGIWFFFSYRLLNMENAVPDITWSVLDINSDTPLSAAS